MDDLSSPTLERTAGPVYFLAFLFLALPFIDYIMNVWPINPGLVNWRYGAIGLSSGFLLTPLLGFVMLLVAGVLFGHRKTLIITGVLAGTVAIVLALSTMLFVLDSLQMRRGTVADTRWVFDAGVIKSILKLLTGVVTTAWVALVSFRGLPHSASKSKRGAGPLVVG